MTPTTCAECTFLVDDDGHCFECTVQEQYDTITKPKHYNHTGGIECIEYIKQILGKEGFIAYCRGNVMKYNHRAYYKGNQTEDMAKAEQYLKWANETLRGSQK